MSKQGTLFNPGKLLEVLENGLTFLSVRLETAVEKKLRRYYRKDRKIVSIKKREAERKKQNKERAKLEDISLKKDNDRQAEISERLDSKMSERMQELDTTDQEPAHDAQMDRE